MEGPVGQGFGSADERPVNLRIGIFQRADPSLDGFNLVLRKGSKHLAFPGQLLNQFALAAITPVYPWFHVAQVV